MASAVQWAKALGKLPNVPLDKLGEAAIEKSVADEIVQTTCGCPDNQDPEIAALNPDTPEDTQRLAHALELEPEFCEHLIRLHQQAPPAGAEGAGSGSHPKGCQGKRQELYPNHHAALLYIERRTFSSNWTRELTDAEWALFDQNPIWGLTAQSARSFFTYRNQDLADDAGRRIGDQMNLLDVVTTMCQEGTRLVGCALIRVFDGQTDNLHVYGKNMSGGLLGYAYFPDGSCRSHSNIYLRNNWVADLKRKFNLKLHEIGHAIGLGHKFGTDGVMSYSPRFMEGFSKGTSPYRKGPDPSLNALQKYFDWRTSIPPKLETPTPVPPVPQPPTGPIPQKLGELRGDIILTGEPPTNQVAIRGELELFGTFSGEKYYCRPKPGSPGIYEVVRSPE